MKSLRQYLVNLTYEWNGFLGVKLTPKAIEKIMHEVKKRDSKIWEAVNSSRNEHEERALVKKVMEETLGDAEDWTTNPI